jgi:hypothetical protein
VSRKVLNPEAVVQKKLIHLFVVIAALALVVAVGVCEPLSAQRREPPPGPPLPPPTLIAELRMDQAIANHPEPLVRENLRHWLREGLVRRFSTNEVADIGVVEFEEEGKKEVRLVYKLSFIFGAAFPNLSDRNTVLALRLYHVAVHLDDHFSGRIPLPSLVRDGPDVPARLIWNMELSATLKERVLAIKLGRPELMRTIHTVTRKEETPEKVLEGFLEMMLMSDDVRNRPELAEEFRALYKEELAKLKMPKR